MVLLYNLFLFLYRAAVAITALWNGKARAWQQGRRGQWAQLGQRIPPVVEGQKRFWMHCASLGEFEQGRPVLEALKAQHPNCIVILSFFSPSGYEVRKSYAGADAVCYLPLDGAFAAKRFLDIVQPSQALFVKYEFWHYYLKELSLRQIPAVLVSGAFRDSQPFFQWWGGFFRKILDRFSILTVQDKRSEQLLNGIRLGEKTHLTGDTRYDRVAQIAKAAESLPLIEIFKGTGKLIIAGSTWPEDERILKACLSAIPHGWKMIIAPHEIDAAHLNSIKALFGEACVFYSAFKGDTAAKVLVIDNIGMLSSLYRYGEIAWVGGGFNKSGIHNVLEPAVFGLPVFMGPNYQKFPEAVEMVKAGIAFSYNFPVSRSWAEILREEMDSYYETGVEDRALTKSWIHERTGATAKILALLPIV